MEAGSTKLLLASSVVCCRLSDGEKKREKKARKAPAVPRFLPFFFFFFVFALSQFSGPDYLGAWNRLLRQLSVKSYFFYRIEERLSENHSGVFLEVTRSIYRVTSCECMERRKCKCSLSRYVSNLLGCNVA